MRDNRKLHALNKSINKNNLRNFNQKLHLHKIFARFIKPAPMIY